MKRGRPSSRPPNRPAGDDENEGPTCPLLPKLQRPCQAEYEDRMSGMSRPGIVVGGQPQRDRRAAAAGAEGGGAEPLRTSRHQLAAGGRPRRGKSARKEMEELKAPRLRGGPRRRANPFDRLVFLVRWVRGSWRTSWRRARRRAAALRRKIGGASPKKARAWCGGRPAAGCGRSAGRRWRREIGGARVAGEAEDVEDCHEST